MFLEPRYEKFAYGLKRPRVIKANMKIDTIVPIKKIDKHIAMILRYTNVKIKPRSSDFDFSLSKEDIENYRQWLMNNCTKAYSKFYKPPEKNYIYGHYKTWKKHKKRTKFQTFLLKHLFGISEPS
jgi:hypothetical protein